MSYDAIVIGGRVAGAATAMLLARGGRRVLVVDRATFPSDTISTHLIWQRGVNYLIEWGLGDRLAALGAPPVAISELDFGDFTLSGAPPAVGRARFAFGPRRTRLDHMLIEAAREAGAEVREAFTVDEILFEDGRVVGIRSHGRSGATVVDRGKVVIGADGVHSTVARAVGAPEYNTHPKLACWYYTYWSGIRADRLRLFNRPDNVIGMIPTCDGLVGVGMAWPQARFAEVKQDVERHYLAALDAAPAFKDELLSGRREERFYGTGDVPNFFRKPYGPGWALVGDAGYYKDPILAQGITDAFRDSALLTGALEDVFEGRAAWEGALGRYEAARNRAVEGIYGMTVQFASMAPPPPEVHARIAGLRYGPQSEIDRYLGTVSGAVPVEEFWARPATATA